jgi:hypothetical protein
MPQRLTKFQFEYKSEEISQEIRGLKLEQLLCDKSIEENKLEAKKIDIETSKEGIRKSKLGLESAQTANDISEEKLIQSKDQLNFERAMTGVNREMLFIQGKEAVLALEQAKVQFEENTKLFELRYQVSGTTEFNAIGGK